jgi:hypothetical protein
MELERGLKGRSEGARRAAEDTPAAVHVNLHEAARGLPVRHLSSKISVLRTLRVFK